MGESWIGVCRRPTKKSRLRSKSIGLEALAVEYDWNR